jgi:adenine-specific DNA-methyltransferase
VLDALAGIVADATRRAESVLAEVRDGGHPALLTRELVGGATDDGLTATSRLVLGDNLLVMAALLADAEITGSARGGLDLIYVDPPFDSGADYRLKLALAGARPQDAPVVIEQVAYSDAWTAGTASYLQMLTTRLVLMRELLSDSGSICVHLDWHASHYVRVVLDEVFGRENFINEVIWRYGKMSNATRRFPQNHDVILIYAKTADYFFAPVRAADSEYKTRFRRHVEANRVVYGAVKHSQDKLVCGRVRKLEQQLGRPLQDSDVLFDFDRERKTQDDVFYDISIVKGNAAENVGFDTQKPVKLVARLIEALCPAGGVVADFFAGSGTTAVAAAGLGRCWIAADSSPSAVSVTRKRLVAAGAHPFRCERLSGPSPESGTLAATARVAADDAGRAVLEVTLTGYVADLVDAAGLDARAQDAVTAVATRDPLALIDYWAIDPSYDGVLFRSRWQCGRGIDGTDPLHVVTTARLDAATAARLVCVRAFDVFGRESEVCFTPSESDR